MNFQDVMKEAKADIGPYCKVCPVCNGIACKGQIPGPGGKATGSVFIRNYAKIQDIKVNLDTLYGKTKTDTTLELFGKTFDLPVFTAPVGAVQMHYSDKYNDLTYSQAVLEGARQSGTVAFTGDGAVDAVYEGTIEAIKALGGWGIPTIKPWEMPTIDKKVKMAEDAGAMAIAMDIDAAGLAFLAKQDKPVGPLSMEQLKQITSSNKLPFILKGVMTVKGALKALEAGVSAIVVSNHGGRVLDQTPATIEVLPEIVEAVQGRMKVLIDGGFRSGLDVFKALALGADGVMICRPFVTAVFGGGQEGVIAYYDQLKTELVDAMVMTGANTLDEIDHSKLFV